MQHEKHHIYFNNCAGIYHPAQGRIGVVICASHGYEELCSHQPMRLFAEQLAACGLPVLRFDYSGTGNSLGTDYDANRLEAWIHSIYAAVQWLTINSDVDEVVIVGFRLGGLLAAYALTLLPDVKTLVLVAPVQSGRLYLREMKIQSRIYPVSDNEKDNGLNSIGFHISQETAAKLATLTLMNADISHLKRVLILADGIETNNPLAVHFHTKGAEVSCDSFSDLQNIISDPILSLGANRPFAKVVEYLRVLSPVNGRVSFVDRRDPNLFHLRTLAPYRAEVGVNPAQLNQLIGDTFTETPLRFGTNNALFGMLCEPKGSTQNTTILIVNGGANHHIGWARQNTHLARHLSEQGYCSLRVDFAGLGESETSQEKTTLYNHSQRADIVEAVEHLARLGHTKIMLFGSCSGAQVVFHCAQLHPNISAIALVNLLRFKISKQEASVVGGAQSFRSTANYIERLRDPQAWKKLIAGGIPKIKGLVKEYARRVYIYGVTRFGHAVFRVTGSLAYTHSVYQQFEHLARANKRILIIYSDDDNGLDELFIHVGKNASLLKRHRGIKLCLLKNADHNLTAKSAQKQVQERFLEFLGTIK